MEATKSINDYLEEKRYKILNRIGKEGNLGEIYFEIEDMETEDVLALTVIDKL